jgi:hypothetical protein
VTLSFSFFFYAQMVTKVNVIKRANADEAKWRSRDVASLDLPLPLLLLDDELEPVLFAGSWVAADTGWVPSLPLPAMTIFPVLGMPATTTCNNAGPKRDQSVNNSALSQRGRRVH